MSIGSGMRRSIVSGTVVLVTIAFVVGFSNAAQADQEPAASRTPVPAATSASPEATTTSTSDASSAPTTSPTPTADTLTGTAPAAEPLGGADPSLAVQNAAHNHAMGSTIPSQSTSTGMRAFAAPETLAATAGPPGLPGLDVSGWQVLTRANWTTIYNNGARFAYVKATEGTSYTSSQFAEQYNDSYAAGLAHGAYHFATPNTSTGAAQATYFVKNGGGWSADGRTLPPLLDIEYNPYGATCYGLSQSAMVSWIQSFSSTMRSLTGRYPAIYSTTDWWTQCTGNSSAFANNPLFIARYTTASTPGTLPASWSKYTFWQWADSGIFPGDQDVFNGTLSQLTTLALGGSGTPTPSGIATAVVTTSNLAGRKEPDVVARRTDGSLWLMTGNGSGGLNAPAKLSVSGSGYDMFVAPGDLNGDGRSDLLARKPDGTLWFFAGNGSGGFAPAIQIGSGWDSFTQILGPGDLNGDSKPDIVGIKPDGTMWLYAGTGGTGAGGSGLAGGVLIGTGWNMYNQVIASGDLNGDGHPDLLGRDAQGNLWFYAGTGGTKSGISGLVPRAQVGTGWGMFSNILGIADLNGGGNGGLLGVKPDGTAWVYPGDGTTGVRSAVVSSVIRVGTGWNTFGTILGPGDLNGDKKPDILGVKPDGTLWFYAGTGTTGPGSGLIPGVKVGTGWATFTFLLTGDFNGDGKTDILARKPDGTLWFYAGTGTTGPGSGVLPGVLVGTGWNSFTAVVAGDFNGDGKTDILARKPDGTLWFYAGTGTTGPGSSGLKPGTQIGIGWNSFNALLAGDFNADGTTDILGRKTDGTLWFYRGLGTTAPGVSGVAPGTKIGTGWGGFTTMLAPGDVNSDGYPDLLVRAANGDLDFSKGSVSGAASGLGASRQVGTGWNVYG